MKVSRIGEFGLIDRIKKITRSKDKSIIIGIGDDAAAIKISGVRQKAALLTTDTLVEGVHFDLKYFNYFELGWKLMAANLSDIAAMGGVPKYALVTLGINNKVSVTDIDKFYKGMKILGKKFNVGVVGGDIVRSPKSLFFTMDMFGFADKVIKRSGAKAGDLIVSIGKFGGSAAGLAKLKRYGRKAKGAGAHLMPVPMVKEGKAAARYANSMIDNSDGLARCLIEICKASRVGAKVYLNNIPLASGADLGQALNGGEDYNLVYTVPIKKYKKIGTSKVIGQVTKDRKIVLIDGFGRQHQLKGKGYEQL